MTKRRIVGTVLVGLGVIALGFGTFVATRPSRFHIERSITTTAPAEVAFAQVDDFHAWGAWSPYDKLDPQMKKSFDGPPKGVGSAFAWSGNAQAGEGRMTIETSEPASRIGIKLEFTKPFACTNAATFTFAPAAEGTKITWAMDGENTFLGKAASVFFDMDKLVGADFERGLASLEAVSKKVAASNAVVNNAAR